MLATGLKLPGAVTEFTQKAVKAVTLNFGHLSDNNADYVTYNQRFSHKTGLLSAGYQFISVSANLGFTLLTLFYLTKLLFISTNIILFFVKKKTRCGQLRLGR